MNTFSVLVLPISGDACVGKTVNLLNISYWTVFYTPNTITKENLLKALPMGERNDDPLKYNHNKKIQIQYFGVVYFKSSTLAVTIQS